MKAVVELMKNISVQTDPQEMVNIYGTAIEEFTRVDGYMALSRRGLTYPWYRVTRNDIWPEVLDPWKQRDKLPLLKGGILADIIYGNEPKFVCPLEVPADDPAADQFPAGIRCLAAIPHYDKGESLNMGLHLFKSERSFDAEYFPDMVWTANLFGRAVNNLALSRELGEAYEKLDKELRVVEELQRSLLPRDVPALKSMRMAAHYQTSARAGGDYYDFFELGGEQWGIFVADVSGHGTPAAVVMAVTHALAHAYPGMPRPPSLLMHYLNQKLCASPATDAGNFVTAFYGIYDDTARTLTYSTAGHPPPRLRKFHEHHTVSIEGASGLPLGISPEERYEQKTVSLETGDCLAIYTDGIPESFNRDGEMFGNDRLDAALLEGGDDPQHMINAVLERLGQHTGMARGEDDRTLLTAVVGGLR